MDRRTRDQRAGAVNRRHRPARRTAQGAASAGATELSPTCVDVKARSTLPHSKVFDRSAVSELTLDSMSPEPLDFEGYRVHIGEDAACATGSSTSSR